MSALLEIRDLSVGYGPVAAVSHVDLDISEGEIVGIAGESGSGKTTLCAAVMRSLPDAATVSGHIGFDGRELLALSARELRALRGRAISMILQNPMTSLDPLYSIGNQVGEILRLRGGVARGQVRQRAIEALRAVHLSAPEARLRQYPHELSGGMRQRVLIGMASATAPRLLLADEPTTALDATVQEEILLLFDEIRRRYHTAIAIVTHDLGIIRRICDRVVIMYAGRIVEDGAVEDIFVAPRHPYTRALLASIPRVVDGHVELQAIPGQVPDLRALGDGCAFADRCPVVLDRCRTERPGESRIGDAHRVFCWRADMP